MARVRTFLAIDPGKPLRDKALAVQNQFAESGVRVKWVEAANLHLTLLFLGEVEERALPEVCNVTAETVAQHAPFAMSLEGLGCFPNPRRPRVLWIGVGQGKESLGAIHDGLEEALCQLGCYRREERSFTPHLTLGRVQSDQGTEALSTMVAQKHDWRAGSCQVTEILVMSSELQSGGPLHMVMSRAKLQGADE